MSAYLGMLGRLVPIYSNPTMDVGAADSYTFETTLEGRVKAQVLPTSPRSWSLSGVFAQSTDVGVLEGFAAGEWGRGPFIWVAPDAPAVNLLTPDESLCGRQVEARTAAYQGGPMVLTGGLVAGQSLMVTNPGFRTVFGALPVPVIPGQPVTASMWVRGANAGLRLSFQGPDGATILPVESARSASAAEPVRLQVTGTPPEGAVSCILSTVNALQIARPAITWTSKLFPWGAGRGCQKAVISTSARTARAASLSDPQRNYSDISYTITEVG